jgi:ribosome-associated heat shock protein Hsp15
MEPGSREASAFKQQSRALIRCNRIGKKVVMTGEAARQRLDKWLWFARMARTRALAQDLIENGYVRVDGRKTQQPAKQVGPGHVLTIALAQKVIVLEILGCADRRGSYPEAQDLYRLIGPDGPEGD